MSGQAETRRGLPPAPTLPPIGILDRTVAAYPSRSPARPGAPSWFGSVADAHADWLSLLSESQSRYLALQDILVTQARQSVSVPRTSTQHAPFLSPDFSPGRAVATLAELLPIVPSEEKSIVIELPKGLVFGEGAATSVENAGSIEVQNAAAEVLASLRPGDRPPDPIRATPDVSAADLGARVTAALSGVRSGRLLEAFGVTFAATAAAVRPPAISDVVPATVESVSALTLSDGGGCAAGRVRTVQRPVVERVVDAALELGTILMQASGATVDQDGWRFHLGAAQVVTLGIAEAGCDPVDSVDVAVELLLTPDADVPTGSLRVRATVGETPCVRLDGLVLTLLPDWPAVPDDASPDADALGRLPAALEQGGIVWDHHQLLASTRQRPSTAYGPMFAGYDRAARISRLPGPPLMVMSRVIAASGEPGSRIPGMSVTSAYVVDPDAWYFGEGGEAATMPIAVLMEILLQPCGWLSLYGGFVNTPHRPVRFRNLDGNLQLHEPISRPDAAQVIVVRCALSDVTQMAQTVLLRFSLEATIDGRRLVELDTVFGYFSDTELSLQVGLSVGDRIEPDPTQLTPLDIDLTGEPEEFFGGADGLPRGRLRMVDHLVAWSPRGGAAGKGRLTAQQLPKADAWYFTSHFFQDPVQPGSLGVEGLWQTLKSYALLAGLGGPDSTFAMVAGQPLRWKYRGQVQPSAGQVSYDVEITEQIREGSSVTLVARGTLSVDDKTIYRVDGLGLRITSPSIASLSWRCDRASVKDLPFLADHRPNHTVAVMPMMGMVEMIGQAVLTRYPHRVLAAVEEVHVSRWLPVETAPSLRIVLEDEDENRVAGRLEAWRTAIPESLSRYETVAAASFVLADDFPPAPPSLAPLGSATTVELPYVTGEMFHGPAFQLLRSMQRGDRGATGIADAVGELPVGVLNPGLLDTALHPIPHDRMHLWFPDADPRDVGYPSRIRRLTFHGPTPRGGKARIEVRAGDRLDDSGRFFNYHIQILTDDEVWADLDIVTVNFRRSRLVDLPAALRRDVMEGAAYFPSARLGDPDADVDAAWTVRLADIQAANWLPGSVERVFGVPAGAPDLLVQTAAKEALAQRTAVHPKEFEFEGDGAVSSRLPYSRFTVRVVSATAEAATVSVTAEVFDSQVLASAFATECPTLDPAAVEGLLRRRIGRLVAPVRRIPPDRSVTLVRASSIGEWSALLRRTVSVTTGVPVSVETVTIDSATEAPGPHLLVRVFPMGGSDPRWDVRFGWAQSREPSELLAEWHALEPRRAPDEPVPDVVADDVDPDIRCILEALD